jgi:hypothetical protein
MVVDSVKKKLTTKEGREGRGRADFMIEGFARIINN